MQIHTRICIYIWHVHPQTTYASHIMVPYRHSALTSIDALLIQTTPVPLHLTAQKITWSIGYSMPAISTTQYRSKVYYNHFHSNNVKYHNDSTSDIQWIVKNKNKKYYNLQNHADQKTIFKWHDDLTLTWNIKEIKLKLQQELSNNLFNHNS